MKKKAIWIAVAVFLIICISESLIKTREALKAKEEREAQR